MQVSPVDIQAWASDTGAEYPSTPAEKAAVLPAVMAWKQEQLQDAAASRGQNAINVPLMAAAGAGLGIAGLAAFNHFRKQGYSEPVAAEKARKTENDIAPVVAASTAAPETAYRTVDPELQALRARSSSFSGPRLRNDESGPTAATLETRGGRNIGSTLARKQGQYKARSASGFHDPDLAVLDTPAKREAYLAGMADAKGVDSEEFQQAQQLIAAMETSTGDGVNPRDFIKGIAPQDRYGTSTAAEQAKTGRFLAQSRTKSNKSAQADYRPRDTTPQREAIIRENGGGQLRALLEAAAAESSGDMGATVANVLSPGAALGLIEGSDGRRKAIGVDPKKASVFYLDTDGQYRTYLGSGKIGSRKKPFYTGRKLDGSPISESDLAYFPTNDSEFYARSGLAHPALAADEIAANAGAFTDARYATDEDQAIKGMLESLGPSDPRFSDGIRKDGVSDNWTVGRVSANSDPRLPFTGTREERVPLDVSGFQSELEAPAAFAGGRLRRALEDHRANTGKKVPESVAITWATDLGRQHGVDPASVLRGAGFQSTASQPERTPRTQTHALAAGSGDALDRVYNSLGMHAGADAWQLEGMVRSGDIRGAASALASQLPALTQVNAGGLRGMGQDEKLNLVAEGVTAGLQDLSTVLSKYPEAASKFGIGKGAGGFGIDAYLKSYVRDWVTVRGLQLDPTGQPTYQVPNDAFEILAHRAHQNGHDTLVELDHTVRGSSNGLLGALKLDRLVSSAQSTKEGDPNTNATSFAQTVFDMTDRDLISTRLLDEAAGDVKLSFGTRRTSDTTAGFYNRNPSEDSIDDRISEYSTLADGTVTDYPGNATLAAQISGADYRTPEGKARRDQAKAAQSWITANADTLERQRADLNRGLIGGQSVGRGFVISANERGAFIDGDTAGMNAAYREEPVNDEDTTPLDRAQDNEREARINNQVFETEGIEVELEKRAQAEAGIGPSTPTAETEMDSSDSYPRGYLLEQEAKKYRNQKLYFKNLGPNSRGAMNEGDAQQALEKARRYRQQSEDIAAYASSRGEQGSPWTAPVLGNGNDVILERDTDTYTGPRFAGFDEQGQELPRTSPWLSPPRSVSASSDRPASGFGSGIDPYGTYGQKGFHSVLRPPGNLYGQLSDSPRADVTIAGSTETAARHRAALEARIGGAGESFRDDENLRDQIAVSTGSIAAGRRANAQTSAAALELAQRPGGYGGGELEPAQQPQILQLDHGTASGLGRSGSTFEQAPIAAAPISAVPAAAIEQLNTLSSSLERPVASYTQQEINDARARHIGDYISKAATPTFDKRDRQTSGWTGGDSWHGGATLAGRADRNVGAYVPPSDAMVSTLAKLARRRAGVA